MLRYFVYVAVAVFGCVTGAVAQDGLYDAPPPPDAAFVRVISATGEGSTLLLGSAEVEVPAEGLASPYYVFPQGALSLEALSLEATITAQKYYSVVVSGNSARLIDDTLSSNLTKATVVFYNLTSVDGLDLTTADGATAVFSDISANASANVAVNPIAVGFAVAPAGAAPVATDRIQLDRGRVYSIVATGDASYKLTITENSVALPQQ